MFTLRSLSAFHLEKVLIIVTNILKESMDEKVRISIRQYCRQACSPKFAGIGKGMAIYMIKWAEKLYLSEDIKKKKKKIMRAVEKGNLTFEIYCITHATNTDNLFDIINVNELAFSYYTNREIYIIGLAGSKGQAKLLVRDMVEEIYSATGEFQVRDYF